jgi:hypothetical protein
MPLTHEQINEWAIAYIQAQPHACLTADHPLWWAVDRFMELTDRDNAEDAWLVILQILARNPAQVVLEFWRPGRLKT